MAQQSLCHASVQFLTVSFIFPKNYYIITSPSLNKCPFKWWCPISSPVIILSWFRFQLSNSLALLAEGPSMNGLPVLLLFPARQSPDHSVGNLVDVWREAQVLLSGSEEPCMADGSAISFPSVLMCPGTHTVWILVCCASFTRNWWQSQINSEFIWKLSRALMAAWLLEIIQIFLHV
jgi:hypothetical protein